MNPFEELVNNRKEWAASSRKNAFNIDDILAGLYSDSTHCIYEILQNAEDAGASEVFFELFEDRLVVQHNGADFNFENIKAITGIGISTKKTDLNAIGKFGIGFKSVFAITKTPHIYSGKYRIKIEDFVVPSTDANASGHYIDTTIILPFNRNWQDKDTFTKLSSRLEKIGLETLLFLRHIKRIKWKIWTMEPKEGDYSRTPRGILANVNRITLKSKDEAEEYLIVDRPLSNMKNLRVEIAYKLGKDQNGREVIIPKKDSKLVVFFPTETYTFLNFLLQGPYKTTPNRENIPLSDEENKVILEETGKLVVESISVIKRLNYLNTSFLEILPLNLTHKVNSQIYSKIYDEIKQAFLSNEELLPTSKGGYTTAKKALLARGKELTDFLDSEDIKKLFGKEHWLDANITIDKTRELRNYLLNELKIREVDFADFTKWIGEDFLNSKTDDWMISFYTRLLENRALMQNLKKEPIIRLEDDSHLALLDYKDNFQVYLPREGESLYKTVKRSLTKDKNSLAFLKEFGLEQPNILAEIKEFIVPKYMKKDIIKDEKYLEDFDKLIKGYDQVTSSKKKDFTEDLSGCTFIDATNNKTSESKLLPPSNVYLVGDDLKKYFTNIGPVYFVSEELYKRYGEEVLVPFLKDVGVEDCVRRIPMHEYPSMEERTKYNALHGHSHVRRDYLYDGLDEFVKDMTLDKSLLLWKLILKNIETFSDYEVGQFFKGEFRYQYYGLQRRYFDARFLGTLRNYPWFVDKNGNFRKACEITITDLALGYEKEKPNIQTLLKLLNFKPEIINQLPDEERQVLELYREGNLSLEDLRKLKQEKEKMQSEPKGESWAPPYAPDEVEPEIEDIGAGEVTRPDLKEQSNRMTQKEPRETQDNEEKFEKTQRDPDSSPNRKIIGLWGEKCVYSALKREYKKIGEIVDTEFGFKITSGTDAFEVFWLNMKGNVGKGYDFTIKKNGVEIEYIEVKTKTGDVEEMIEITGTQWDWARRLDDQNEGDKYLFYIVFSAGTENTKIKKVKNPVKLWREGKLYVQPLYIRL